MQLDLEPHEINQLIEALDALKTKHAFIKKEATYEERTAKLLAAEELEAKLRQALQST